MGMAMKSAAEDVRSVEFYERGLEEWMAELRRVQGHVERWVDQIDADLGILLADPETSQDWDRIAAMQALLDRARSETGKSGDGPERVAAALKRLERLAA